MGGSAGRNRSPSTASVAAYRRATFSSGKRTSAPGKAGALVIFSFASALFGTFRLRGLGLRCGGVGRVDVMI